MSRDAHFAIYISRISHHHRLNINLPSHSHYMQRHPISCIKPSRSSFKIQPPASSPHQLATRRAPSVTLDRFRALRRRHEPSLADGDHQEAPSSPRKRSPAWFHKMHRTPGSVNRSRSPSLNPSSEVRQREPFVDLDKETKQDNDDEDAAKVELDASNMPAFLQLGRADLQSKFEELTWLERNRVAMSHNDPSPMAQWARASGPHTQRLDRYANVHPWNNNRVRLRVPEGTNDYINASPIVLKSQKSPLAPENKYIAMQGPKEGSTSHVWRMIWDELASPAVIVMLTETHEGGQEKCWPYFPRTVEEAPMVINSEDEFGDGFKGTVQCLDSTITGQGDAIEVRKMIMKIDGDEEGKIVWHLLYTKWPDYGVPAGEDLVGFFRLMQLSKSKNENKENPRIIHCSAGVGRTGTLITLEHLMDELEAGHLVVPNEADGGDDVGNSANDEDEDLIFDTVNELRMQRRMMVQSDVQYYFIYQVLRGLWERKYLGKSLKRSLGFKDTGTENEGDVFGDAIT